MPNSYVGNTGDTNENPFVVQDRGAINDHLEQLSSVKGFTNLWQFLNEYKPDNHSNEFGYRSGMKNAGIFVRVR